MKTLDKTVPNWPKSQSRIDQSHSPELTNPQSRIDQNDSPELTKVTVPNWPTHSPEMTKKYSPEIAESRNDHKSLNQYDNGQIIGLSCGIFIYILMKVSSSMCYSG